MSKSICQSMGRFSSTWRTFAATSLALSLITLIAGTQLPAMAAWHPPGPTQAAPVKRAVVRSATVHFRWHMAKNARGYDLRVARDRRFSMGMQTVHMRTLKARLCSRRGAGTGRCARPASSTRAGRISRNYGAPHGDVYPPTRPSALRVTAVAENSITVTFGAAKDDRGVVRYELLGGGKVLARGAAAPLTALGLPCATCLRCACAPRRRRARLAALARRNARSRPCTDKLAPDAPGNMRAITVADTSVALAWDPARDPDGSVRRYAVYRNGVLLGCRRAPASWPAAWRPRRRTTSRSPRSTAAITARPTAPSTRRRRLRCLRPGPPTRTCSRPPARASRTCNATTGRSP